MDGAGQRGQAIVDPADLRRTKILATLGPATSTDEAVDALVDAGMDAARVNASHGDHASHRESIERIRRAADRAGRPIGILYDLQGPKIRVGSFDTPAVPIAAGQEFTLAVGRPAEEGELPSDYDLLDQDVKVGQPLLIDDGSLASVVVAVEPGKVIARAENAHAIQQRKGINLPDSDVSAPAITEKDRLDALFAAEQGVDAIALSFVRSADDVLALADLLDRAGHGRVPIVAKIETPSALGNLEAIVERSWGVMVARGDLGVELSPEEVPMAQKRIIALANNRARPVITATQMLESMIHSPRPTRAETSDIANAVLDGTDVVMLSGETAVGERPAGAVDMMARVVRATEAMPAPSVRRRRRERGIDTTPEAVADAATQVAHHIGARYIAVFTSTGASALLVAQRRPGAPILAFTPDPAVLGRLTLVSGVQPQLVARSATVHDRVGAMDRALLTSGHAEAGDTVVICMGAPNAKPGSTDVVMVHKVGEGWP